MYSSESNVSAGSNGKSDYDRLRHDLEGLKTDLSKLVKEASSTLNNLSDVAQRQIRRGYRSARSDAASVISDAARQGSETLDAVQDAATTIERSLESAVRERPIAAMGLAIGLGFLVGVTWRR